MTQKDFERRIWIDGCFDFTHFGHCNAILQSVKKFPSLQFTMFPCSSTSTSTSTKIIIGIHNDKDIYTNKGGFPVMNELERYYHIEQLRWCSGIFRDAPYVTDPQIMDSNQCQYVIHGDDIVLDANGEDCYTKVRAVNRFVTVKRTENVSTTEIIHRIITDALCIQNDNETSMDTFDMNILKNLSSNTNGFDPWCFIFHKNFNNVVLKGGYTHTMNNTILYIDNENDFDIFNVQQIEKFKFLKHLFPKKHLIIGCGLANDKHRQLYNTLQERCYNVLSYKQVDGLIVSPDLDALNEFSNTNSNSNCNNGITIIDNTILQKYIDVSIKEQSFKWSFLDINKQVIVERVIANKKHYIERNIKKGMIYE